MASNIDNIDITIVNSITLADLFGITDRRVRQLADEGVFQAISRGKYEMRDCIRKYCIFLRQAAESCAAKTEIKINYDTERAMHEKAKREKAELQLKVMKGDLHRSEDIELIMTDMITKAKTKLLSLPSKLAPMVINRSDISMVQGLLQMQVEEALNELADYTPELFINDDVLQGDEDE